LTDGGQSTGREEISQAESEVFFWNLSLPLGGRPPGGGGGVGPAGSVPSPGFRTIYIFLIDTIFLALAVQGATVDA